ncbi:MAG: peptidylprolyl isomerase [Oscillibacter sp.]
MDKNTIYPQGVCGIRNAAEPQTATQQPAELLAQVNAAISTVLSGGQSYKIGSRSLTRADLAMLKSMRDDLEAQLAAEDNAGLLGHTSVAYFDGR